MVRWIDKPSPVFFSPRDEGNRLAPVCSVPCAWPSWEGAAPRGLGVYLVRVGGRHSAVAGRLPGAWGRAPLSRGWASTRCVWEGATQQGLGVYLVRVGGCHPAGAGRLPGACGRAPPSKGWAPTRCVWEGATQRGLGVYPVRVGGCRSAGAGRLPGACGRAPPSKGWAPTRWMCRDVHASSAAIKASPRAINSAWSAGALACSNSVRVRWRNMSSGRGRPRACQSSSVKMGQVAL